MKHAAAPTRSQVSHAYLVLPHAAPIVVVLAATAAFALVAARGWPGWGDLLCLLGAMLGGQLAVVDVNTGRLVLTHEITGHNIRGLALTGNRLLVAHQILDQKAATTEENIRRGVLMANVVRSIPLDRLTDPRADLDRDSQLTRLGSVGAGAGSIPDLAAGIAVAHEQHVLGLRPPRNQHRHGLGFRKSGQVIEVAVLAIGVLHVVIAMTHRRCRQDRDRFPAHHAHQLAPPAGELVTGHG